MKLNVENLEFGLKVFYQIKYEKREIEFTELPNILQKIHYLKNWVEKTAEQDPILIEAKELFEIEDLFEKYFRDEFLKYYFSTD